MKRDSYMIDAVTDRAPKMLRSSPPAHEAGLLPLVDSQADDCILAQDFCFCDNAEGIDPAFLENGLCENCWVPEYNELLVGMADELKEEEKKKESAAQKQDHEKPPRFLLSVPAKFLPDEPTPPKAPQKAPAVAPPAPKPSITRNCYRYTFTEEKALVHAKLRLQFEGFVGVEKGMKLTDYYEYYLRKLAPTDFLRYPKRDGSALTRKFKAIKHNSPKLLPYIDRHVECCFWNELVQLVAHKPLLHPIFYKEKPSGSTCE